MQEFICFLPIPKVDRFIIFLTIKIFILDLFRAVAAMSGADVSYHSIIGKPALAYNNTLKLGRYLGCVKPMAKDVWDCILQRSTNDIIQALSSTSQPSIPVKILI